MLANLIRRKFQDSMGIALDLIRLSDVGERQLKQLEISLKDRFNEKLIELLAELEDKGIVKKCACLQGILAAKDSQLEPVELRKLYEAKRHCKECGGSGYKDLLKKAKKAENDKSEK